MTARLLAVLGGGVAGLAAADRLNRAGWRVRLVEREESCGGIHRARTIGPYTFDVGSMFYEQDARLFDLAPGLREICPQVMRIQRRIGPDGAIRQYPIDPRELLEQRPAAMARALADLAWSRLTVRQDGTLDAIVRKRLGRSLFDSTGLAAYIARFHHVSPREIDEAFFFHRMAFVARATGIGALARLALRSVLPPQPGNRTRRPLHVRPLDGFEPVFDRILSRLAAAGVGFQFGEELLSLRREGEGFLVRTTSGTFSADGVVSTIPLDTLHRAMFGRASGLVSLGMTTLFVSARRLDLRLGNVLYNYHRAGRWKRATIYSRIYYASPTPREFLSVETTLPPGGRHDPHTAFEDFRQHLTQLGLAEDIVLEGHDHVPDCYPLYRPGSAAAIGEVVRRIGETGVVLAGRQGRFEYLPTSTGVIRRVAEELGAAELIATAQGVAS